MSSSPSLGFFFQVRLVDMSELRPAADAPADAHRSARLCAFMFYQFVVGRAQARAAHPHCASMAPSVE